jgi:uncharacterized protein
MHIHTEQMNQNGFALQFEETAEIFPVLAEMVAKKACEFLTPISVNLKALRSGNMVEVSGNLNTSVRLSCDRCLQEFETCLKTVFSLTYMHREADAMEEDSKREEIELQAEDMGIIYYQGEEIDLTNEIQEQVVMAIPIRALCKRDCRGLCIECGADLNQGDCSCAKKPLTGKFTVLKNFTPNQK